MWRKNGKSLKQKIMPELPEVHTIVAQLNSEIFGEEIVDIRISNKAPISQSKELISKTLVGSNVVKIERIAKLVSITLRKELEHVLLIHLALTGRLVLGGKKEDLRALFVLVFKSGKVLKFFDRRRFGFVKFFGDKKEFNDYCQRFGPDPFSITSEEFEKRLRKKNTAVKNALLDQSVISGVGNIYATDALWIAKINPFERTKNLSSSNYKSLHSALKKILEEGIRHRGSSISDYVDIYGKFGTHQKYFRVYGKRDMPCPRCKSPISVEKLSSRSTYFCKKCQPLKGLEALL